MQLSESQARRHINAAYTKRENWRAINKDAMQLVTPNRDTLDDFQEGQVKAQQNWDGTAPQALVNGANRLMDLVPPFSDWIVIEPGPAAKATLKSDQLNVLREQLAKLSTMANAVVNAGGFQSSVHEMFMDWMVSTGCLIVDGNMAEPEGPVANFTARPLGSFYVEEGAGGQVIRRYFWHKVEAAEVAHTWPDATLPDELVEMVKDEKRRAKKVSICEMEYLDRDESKKPWRYEVFFLGSTVAKTARLVERQHKSPRFITPRNSKTAGEPMGRGMVIVALPDIRTANKIVELTFRAAAMNLLGIWTVVGDEVNTNSLQMVPGAILQVPFNGGPKGAAISRIDTGTTQVQFAELLIDNLRMNIKKALLDQSLPPDAGPVRSATEIAARLRELASELGGQYGRLIDEFVRPLVQRVVDILQERGLVPDGLKIDNFYVQVSVSSPLAREQKLADVQTIVQWLEILAGIGGRELATLGAVLEDVPELLAGLLGIPQEIVRKKSGPEGRTEMQKNFAAATAQGAAPQPGNAAGQPSPLQAAA